MKKCTFVYGPKSSCHEIYKSHKLYINQSRIAIEICVYGSKFRIGMEMRCVYRSKFNYHEIDIKNAP